MTAKTAKGARMALIGAGAMVAAATLAIGGVASAHHSFAMYDSDNQLKLTGTVSKFQWTNPHIYIELDTQPGETQTKVKHYTIECASPGILTRIGWKFNMIKTGDKVQVVIAPLKNGDPGALLKAVKLPDGRVFGNGGPAGRAAIEF
jgi:hypothetical protein